MNSLIRSAQSQDECEGDVDFKLPTVVIATVRLGNDACVNVSYVRSHIRSHVGTHLRSYLRSYVRSYLRVSPKI